MAFLRNSRHGANLIVKRKGLAFSSWLLVPALMVGSLCLSPEAFGRGPGSRYDDFCPDCTALGEATLDEVRGGLQLGGGLMVSFGLQRSVLVNGELASSTTLNTSFASGELTALDLQRSASNLVQIGANNRLSGAAIENLRGGVGTIIQNSADQQLIQNLTTIDIVVRNINFQSTVPVLQSGTLYELIMDSVRP